MKKGFLRVCFPVAGKERGEREREGGGRCQVACEPSLLSGFMATRQKHARAPLHLHLHLSVRKNQLTHAAQNVKADIREKSQKGRRNVFLKSCLDKLFMHFQIISRCLFCGS